MVGEGNAPSRREPRSAQDRLDEAVGLAKAIDLDVQAAEIVPLTRPRPATLLGSGKVHEIGLLIAAKQAGLAIIDHAVSPIQQRNLEKAWDCKVLDRTGLILEIFGERAATREGRLQVELASTATRGTGEQPLCFVDQTNHDMRIGWYTDTYRRTADGLAAADPVDDVPAQERRPRLRSGARPHPPAPDPS